MSKLKTIALAAGFTALSGNALARETPAESRDSVSTTTETVIQNQPERKTYAISDKTLRFRTIRDEVKNTQYAVELEEQIQKIRQWHENTHPRNRTLNIYIAPNMELDDCRDFEVQHPDIKLNFIDEDILADVKVNNQPPADPAASFTELHIGSGVKQKIWISCSEQNPRALKFFDFIVAKLLLLYGQSEP